MADPKFRGSYNKSAKFMTLNTASEHAFDTDAILYMWALKSLYDKKKFLRIEGLHLVTFYDIQYKHSQNISLV